MNKPGNRGNGSGWFFFPLKPLSLLLLILITSYGLVFAQEVFRQATLGTYVIAHRGAHEGIPENSLAAYQHAIDLGCDFIEIDVRTSQDGKFVSVHNASVDKYAKGIHGKVGEMTLQELKAIDIGLAVGTKWKGTRIPTFEEILQLCQGKIGIYLDLKDAPVPELMKIIRKYDMEKDVVWYVPAPYLSKIDNVDSYFGKSFLMPDPGSEENIGSLLEQFPVSVMASDMEHISSGFVEKLHKQHVRVFVDDHEGTKEEWSYMLKLGIDGIQTDHPEELISFLKERNKDQ